VDDQAVKVTRARMIIEFADGRALYWEARDPLKAEVEHLTADPGRMEFEAQPADVVADWLHNGWLSAQPRAALRITGGLPWKVRIEQDSGEIPPELAEQALAWVDAMRPLPGGTLAQLRPYLARIAGRPL
jgi:hypothetical protein